MVNYHARKRVLPHQEIATQGSHCHCHAWLILKAMPRAVTRDEETHYTHCFEAYSQCIINYLIAGKMCEAQFLRKYSFSAQK